MTLKKKHCLLFLAIFVILLLGVTMVSAAEVADANNTQGVKDNDMLSTPYNYDVDKMVQTDVSTTNSEAKVNNRQTSDITNNTDTTNEKTQTTENSEKSNENDITSTKDISKSIQKVLKTDGEGTFTILQQRIDEAGPVLELTSSYKFISGTDDTYRNGVTINKTITIIGNDKTIDGDNLARIFNITGTGIEVKVQGIKFINGKVGTDEIHDDGGSILIDSSNTEIINCTFINNTASANGGAIKVNDYVNNIKIIDSRFTGNKVIGYDEEHGSEIWNMGSGGAIYFGTGCNEGIIDNSTFDSNCAYDGGGAIRWDGVNGQINSSIFVNNSVTKRNGGAILLDGNYANITSSKFYNNSAPYAGGALRLSGNHIFVNDSLFDGNSGSDSWGSAIYLRGNYGNITYSNFTNNYKAEFGGSVYVYGNNSYLAYNIIQNSSAKEGGAVYVSGSNTNISNVDMSYNNATNGGAIYISGANTTIMYTNITHNRATKTHGGALYAAGSHATISYCNFDFNEAKQRGGAIYWESGYTGDIILGCNFTNDSSNSNPGGSIFWLTSSNITIKDCLFVNSTIKGTNGHGGAINLYSNKNGLVDNCTFINCVSAKDGGAIYYANDANTAYNSTLSNCTFINCSSATRSGGAINWKEPNGHIINNTFINCSATYPQFGFGGAMLIESNARNNEIVNNKFINCTSNYGAAIYYRENSRNATHINCIFINNTALKEGGVLFLNGASNNTYDNCTFVNNTASNGGSIYYTSNKGIIIRNSVFANNTNIKNGGFIYLNGSSVSITNTTFFNGSATESGGAFYVNSVSNYNISNNTFDYNSAQKGGAIYVASALVLNDTIFTNNLAENGGALYITRDTTLNGCNLTNNNATKGSAIYLEDGTLNLNTVRLVENQAHSKEFADKFAYTEDGNKHIGGVFTGWDNYLNGIYWDGGDVVTVNVMYLGVGGVINTDVSSSTIHHTINETNQKIVLEIYDRDNYLVGDALETTTDENGKYEFVFTDNSDYNYKLYHPEDEYYTYLVYSFNKNLVNLTVNVTNIVYGDSETIRVNVSTAEGTKPTGNVTVYLNSTLEGFTNRTLNYTLTDEDEGIIVFTEEPLNCLNVSTYDVYVRYSGDERYLSEIATTQFNVTRAESELNIERSSYDYNETGNITFNVIGVNGEDVDGKVFVNITGKETDGTEVSYNDIEVNITRDDNGNIVNNTYELPVLNAGNYDIVAVYNGNANYNSSNNTHSFKVNKALPTVNVTAFNITSDDIYAINIHVEPEVSTNEVALIITSGDKLIKEYVLTLDDSQAYQELDKLPSGTYDVNAYYYGDKNHYERRNTTSFTVSIDDYPISIQLKNMTYGETQLFNITVPPETDPTIKLNDTELSYTMDDNGLIQIDSGLLPVGEYKLNVTFKGNQNYRSNSSIQSFKVTKAESNVEVSAENITYGFNETITVTLPEYGHAVGNISVEIVNSTDDVVESYIVECPADLSGVGINATVIEGLANGTYRVNVLFTNDTNYEDSVASTEFSVSMPIISIFINRDHVYVDENVTLHGIVKEADNKTLISEGEVRVSIKDLVEYTGSLSDYISGTNTQYTMEGVFQANATYVLSGKDIVTSDNVYVTVDRIPTVTTVEVINNTLGNVLIDVVVRENATGYSGIITGGSVNVTVGGVTTKYSIKGANTTILLDQIDTTGDVAVSVVYNGSYKYVNSTGRDVDDVDSVFDKINVVAKASNLTVAVAPGTVGINQTVRISGKVFDEFGHEINSGYVNISVDGMDGEVVEIGSAGYALDANRNTTRAGEVEVQVTYLGQKDGDKQLIAPSVNKTTFTVEKLLTITAVEVLNNTVGNVTIDVKVVVDNETKNPVRNGVLHVTVAGVERIVDFDLSGTTDNNITIPLPEITTTGNISVSVLFNESDAYLSSVGVDENSNEFKNITVKAQGVNLTVAANETAVAIGEHVTITGNLTNGMNQPLGNTLILLNITGMENPVPVWTNSTGGYSYDYTSNVVGTIYVNASFNDTTNTYSNATAQTTFTVNKIPTKTNVTIIDNTIGNVVIHVNVTNLTGDDVTTGHVKVYDSATGVLIGEGDLANGGKDITLDVNTPGSLSINVTYLGTDIYYGSNATDSSKEPGSPDENTITFDVVKQNANITINILNDNVTIGEEVFIWGTVKNANGSLILDGDVNVTINGTNYTRSIVDGTYNITYPTAIAGDFTVNATYLGTTNISSVTSDNVYFTVNKIPTNTTVRIINDTIENVTIEVTVTNATGNLVNTGYIVVNNETQTNIVNGSVTDGKVILTIPSNGNATLRVNVTYIENDYYLASNAQNSSAAGSDENVTVISVAKHNATITINVDPDEVTLGENVTIYGEVRDVNGTLMESGDVVLIIDGVEQTTTLTDGEYSVNYTTTKVGKFTVNATYLGNSIVNNVTSTDAYYTVNKIPTTTNVTILNRTAGNVTIDVTVTGEDGETIQSGVLNLTVNGKESTAQINGLNTTIKLDITTNGTAYVKVVYNGSEKYESSVGIDNDTKNELTQIDVELQNANITVVATPTTDYVGETVNITGKLTNDMGEVIKDAYVTLEINGTQVIVKTNASGEYNYTYTTTNCGSIIVYAKYEPENTYNSVQAETSFNIIKIPTNTSVEILDHTLGNVTIRVRVNDTVNNVEVPNGQIRVYDENYETIIKEANITNGLVDIILPVENVGEYRVIVEYQENDKYLASNATNKSAQSASDENITVILVTKDQQINITATPEVYIGEEVTISGRLVDEVERPIPNTDITIIIDGVTYHNTTDTDGVYTLHNITSKAGTINVTAIYTDNQTVNATTAFIVNKIPTATVVQIVNNTVGNVTINVAVSDKDGESITEGTLEITVGGKTTTKTINSEVTEVKLDINTDDIQVSVKFLEDDKYLNSTGINNDTIPSGGKPEDGKVLENITTSKQQATITVKAIPETSRVGDTVTITGNLTDGMGEHIADAYVEITIDGDKFITETDSNGKYSIENVTTRNGTVDVIATYKGNLTVNNASANTNFKVDKIPTITLVSIKNTTVGNVSIDVMVKDDNENVVTTGQLEITTTENTFRVNITGEVTNIALDYTTNGTKQVSVKYIENDVYLNSTGLDKVSYDKDPHNAETFNNITVTRLNTTITVTALTPVKAGNSTIISGRLVDEQSRPISGAEVVVKVNDTIVGKVTTDVDGLYSLTFNDTIVGTHNVSSIYDGNATYVGTNNTTTFMVTKVNTELTIDDIKEVPVGTDINITGKLEDEFHNPIKDAYVNVTVGDKTETVKTDENGIYTLPYKTTTVGTVNVKVEYPGDEKYNNASAEDTFEVVTNKATLTVVVPTETKVGENTTINGTVTDENGNPIASLPVNVTVNGKTYPTTTDENGHYTVPVNNTVAGMNNVTVTAGNESVEVKSAKDSFLGSKYDTNITLDTINDTLLYDDAVISGRLVDENGNPVANRKINITVDGESNTVETDDNGYYTYKVPTTSVGAKLVTVEFDGDDKYNKVSESGLLNVYKDIGKINLEIPDKNVPGENTTINGTITDENGRPIKGMPVNVTVNGKTFETTTDDEGRFSVPVDNVVEGVNNVTVTSGNDTTDVDTVEDKFAAERVNTTVMVDPIDDKKLGDVVTVSGKLVDADGNVVPDASVTVIVDGVEHVVTTDGNGMFASDFVMDSTGVKLATVVYDGNVTYCKSNNATAFYVSKHKATLGVEVPDDARPGVPVNITGSVTDEDGNPVAGMPVNVTVNGKTFETTTDDEGRYSVPVDNVVEGVNNVTVTSGNETVDVDPVDKEFTATKEDVKLTLNPVKDTVIGKDVEITGQLLDSEGKSISDAPITITVDGVEQNVTTDKDGKYTATFPTISVGEKSVTVTYDGNERYNSAKEDGVYNVVPNNGTIELEVPTDAVAGKATTINGTVLDKDGNIVPNVPVNVTVNGKTYTTTTDENGKFSVPVDNVVVGENDITVTAGNENITVTPVSDDFNARRQDAILTVDPVNDTQMGQTPVITGKLTDEDGQPIKKATVTITVNGETYTVTTNENGAYELEVPDIKVGENNVTVTFDDGYYNTAQANTTFDVTKIKTIVTVDSVVGIVGEKITLVAHVTDEEGNPVTGGNLVFKLNGRTLRSDGRFDTNDTAPLKLKVVDGIVTYTMTADLYLRSAKNITASYSGSYKYEAAKGNVAEANIKKRNAELEVTVNPNPAKQDTDIVISVKVRDVTKNATNATCITTDANLILKINGITLKDDDGNVIRVPVVDTVTDYVYHIPKGTAGTYNNGSIRDYTVMAVYNNSLFYPDTRNTTTYNVNRSIVNINFESTTVKNDVLSIKATFTDYENVNLVGKNKICVKINGITYKENGETKYFTVTDGKVDLTGIKLDSGTKVKSVTLVTGDREAYLSARETTTDITTG